MEEEGHSGKLSDESELLFHFDLAISNSESFMGTHSTEIEALSFAVFHPFPSLFLQIIIKAKAWCLSHSCAVRLKCAIPKPSIKNIIGLNDYNHQNIHLG